MYDAMTIKLDFLRSCDGQKKNSAPGMHPGEKNQRGDAKLSMACEAETGRFFCVQLGSLI
jgi:hypothetical protein